MKHLNIICNPDSGPIFDLITKASKANTQRMIHDKRESE